MEPWQVTLLTTTIAGSLTFIGGLLLGRQSEKKEQRQRKAETAQRYTDKAVQALSQTKLTLSELRPDSLIMESEPGQSWKRVHQAINEYIDTRKPLIEVAYGHPSQEVRDAVTRIDDNAFRLMKATSLFVVSFSPGYREHLSTMLPDYAKDAKEAFNAFQASVDEALALLHRDG